MSDFSVMLAQTLKYEGGYTVDHAGPTNRGITQKTYDNYRKSKGLPSSSVKDIKFGDTKDIYKQDFFDRPKFNTLSKGIASIMFDYGVNSGPGTATKALQTIVGSKVDGIIGPKTNKAVQKYIDKNGEEALKAALLDERANFMADLIEDNPDKYLEFADGWTNRINDLRKLHLNKDE